MASNRKQSPVTPVVAPVAPVAQPEPVIAPTPAASQPVRCSAMRKERDGKPSKPCRQTELVPGHTTCVWHTPKSERPAGWVPTQGLAQAIWAARAEKQAEKQAKLREQAKARAPQPRAASKPAIAPKPERVDALEAKFDALIGLLLAPTPEAKQAAKARLASVVAA